MDKIRARKGLSPIKDTEQEQEINEKAESPPLTLDDQIDNIIEKSRVDDLYKNMARKFEAQMAEPEDERDFEFAPPTDYSKSKRPKYNRR